MSKVSIIIPVYKVEKYILRCVNSVLNQTFTDFEIILIDDGSPDRCPSICNELSRIDDRIRTIHQKNAGVSAARNNGLAKSNGEWILFLDSDDEIDVNTIEQCLSVVNDNIDCVQFGFKSIQGKIIKEYNPSDYDDFFYVDNFPSLTRFIRKSFLNNNNIKYPDGITLAEDWYFNYLLFLANPRTSILNKILYFYYQIPDSLMHNISLKNITDEIKIISVAECLENKNNVLITKRKILTKNHILRKLKDLRLFRNTYNEVNPLMFNEASFKLKILIILIRLRLDFLVKILNRI